MLGAVECCCLQILLALRDLVGSLIVSLSDSSDGTLSSHVLRLAMSCSWATHLLCVLEVLLRRVCQTSGLDSHQLQQKGSHSTTRLLGAVDYLGKGHKACCVMNIL